MKARPSKRQRSGLARMRAGSTRTGYDAWSGVIASLLDESRQAESQRDSSSKPKVARHEPPWVSVSCVNNPNGVVARRSNHGTTPLGLNTFTTVTQGSSCLATLGCMTQSRWDCKSQGDFCSEHDYAVAHYAMGNLKNKVLAAQYKLALPAPRVLEAEIEKTRRLLESPARRMHGKRP